MRFLIVGCSIVAAAWLAVMSFLVHEREAAHAADRSDPCYRANLVLDIYRMKGIISALVQRDRDIVVRVGQEGWDKSFRAQQVQIGASAYCRANQQRPAGNVLVENLDGRELARVVNGKWLSRLYAQ